MTDQDAIYQEEAAASQREATELTPRQSAERESVAAMKARVRRQWAEQNEQLQASEARRAGALGEHPDPGVAAIRARVQQQGQAVGFRTRTLAHTMPAAQEAARRAAGEAPVEEEAEQTEQPRQPSRKSTRRRR
jgi:hypothetical protein